MSSDRPLLPETPAVHEVRLAVRRWVATHGRSVAVGLSGGADSSALTVAAVAEADSVHAVVVDHGLQPGSGDVAARAAAFARSAGCVSVQVVRVAVTGPGGPEAAARAARYRALDEARAGLPVLLGHTLDDQAETVLLGLGRGSGARSLRGMCEFDEPWGRPLLGVRRDVTRRACAELGYTPYDDAHNSDRRFTRVRLREEVLPLLEDVLGGGVAPALARTAAQLREDEDALEELAGRRLGEARVGTGLAVDVLAGTPVAVRRRVLRRWLLDSGASAPTDRKLRAVDDLIGQWRGQGGVAVGGGPQPGVRLVVTRRRGRLIVEFVGRRQGADD
ncbi:tRNA lysidine(34) synthetase TilS [Rhodococcus ruber]|uniref:tRNA(Ile)-lysidine synthase n=1 Tax=Rhodococcus ruber TaxID=1830 RepID=A0A098BP70_9NOCA|nr:MULTISPECIES: tRNA lysidine(34) synthetase TilS [Rhodococcus]MDO2381266.1 tRNA lysidine(34) synthetase TilS [Rhodococcus ruber]AWG97554.1 tRNA lysidine(34) synthetase TilS [Rhodococcus ruber]MCD2127613.1 tRNA lysidine(34) synthetase TilS [Rhodococcus ruber]MCZ1073240.1 tRNA lysidine(34) synthetase TilS [Rhodococcus sp. A5(2022)]MCZ4504098.1 tRNA lysidine(34) synthetase TilS [Rhodococcus ruber]